MPKTDGPRAEDMALAYLQARGLVLIQRNWRTRLGEIDLVMRDGATTVFAEVRMRAHARFGGPAASIDPRKKRKLIASAQLYSMRAPNGRFRIDAVLIQKLDPPVIEWIRDALGE